MAIVSVFRMRNDMIQDFINSSESGMGYQLLYVDQFSPFQKVKQVILVNSNLIFDFETFNNLPLLLNLDDFEIKDPGLFSFQKLSIELNSRYERIDLNANKVSFPPYTVLTESDEKFIRLSAYRDDKRITSKGGVKAGTYATTPNDMTVTPSGLAAVGRYALPNRQPAIYVFEISPPPGTPVYYGTVTPNYGLCGGGVEVFFPVDLPDGSAKYIDTIPIK